MRTFKKVPIFAKINREREYPIPSRALPMRVQTEAHQSEVEPGRQTASRFSFSDIVRISYQSTRSSPQKNSATVPGPVWEPIVVPMLLMTTLPFSFGNFSSTNAATASASGRQADMEI